MSNPFAVAAGLARPQASYYKGASGDRLNQDWVYGRVSADIALRYDAQTLRNRARELVGSNATAAAIPKIFSDNIIGKDGITLQPMLETSRGDPNERINARILEAWEHWGTRGQCTTDRGLSFVDCQKLFVENKVVDGEVLVHLVRGFDNDFGFAIDFIDPDQLDQFLQLKAEPGTNQIRMGIEMDPWFGPVAYHLWQNHPSEMLDRKRIRVPATEIQHSFFRIRPRQSRGVTQFAPIMFELKMLGGYREAELVAARTASSKMGFIQSMREDGVPWTGDPGDPSEKINLETEPGLMEQLPPGYEFKGWDPQHPTAQFDAFDKAILRTISTGIRLSYMSLSGDLRGTSYGSGRIGMLAERATFQGSQANTVSEFNDPVYAAWLPMAVLSGQLDIGTTDVRGVARQRRWHPRSFPWIDPRNDIEAAEREVAIGADSVTRIAAERGRDFEDVMKDRQREMRIAAEYGVPLLLDKGTPIGGPAFDTTDTGADNPQDETAHPGPGEPGDPASDDAAPAAPGGAPSGAPSQNGNGKRPAGKGAAASRIRFNVK